MKKNIGRKSIVSAMIALSMIAGAAGGSILSGTLANAQTPSSPDKIGVQSGQATSATPPATGSANNSTGNMPPSGVFHSNENAAHEATESPAREAQENAGQRPTVK